MFHFGRTFPYLLFLKCLKERVQKRRNDAAELRRQAAELQRLASAADKEADGFLEAAGSRPKSDGVNSATPNKTPRSQAFKANKKAEKTARKGRESHAPYDPTHGKKPPRGGPGGSGTGVQIGSGRPIVYVMQPKK